MYLYSTRIRLNSCIKCVRAHGNIELVSRKDKPLWKRKSAWSGKKCSVELVSRGMGLERVASPPPPHHHYHHQWPFLFVLSSTSLVHIERDPESVPSMRRITQIDPCWISNGEISMFCQHIFSGLSREIFIPFQKKDEKKKQDHPTDQPKHLHVPFFDLGKSENKGKDKKGTREKINRKKYYL